MPSRIVLRIHKGIMPKSGLLNKPLDIFIDNVKVKDIGWGQKAVMDVAAGRHDLAVSAKLGGSTANSVSIHALDGETVRISCYFDVGGTGFKLVNENDPAANAATRTQTRSNASLLSSVVYVNLIGGVALVLGIANLIVNAIPLQPESNYLPNVIANLFQRIGFLGPMGNGIYWTALGLVFLALGFFVKKRSALALTAAVLLYIVDGYFSVRNFLLLGALIPSGNSFIVPPLVIWLFSVIFHVVLIFPMIKGIFTILVVKRREGQAPPVA
jgi:hypothetical protein